MAVFWTGCGPAPTTAAFAPLATGTAVKTLLQILTPATADMRLFAWGISFDGATSSATPVRCELLTTGSIAATVTAHVAAGIQLYSEQGAPSSAATLSTSGTGYNASAEGSITTTKHADLQFIPPTSGYSYDWPDGREFYVPQSTVLRVRVTAAATVNAYCWIRWRE